MPKVIIANISSDFLVVPAPVSVPLKGGKGVTVALSEQAVAVLLASKDVVKLTRANKLSVTVVQDGEAAPTAPAAPVAAPAPAPAPAPEPEEEVTAVTEAPAEEVATPAPLAEEESDEAEEATEDSKAAAGKKKRKKKFS